MSPVQQIVFESFGSIGGWIGPDLPYTWEGVLVFSRPVCREEIGIPAGLPGRIRSSAPAEDLQRGWTPSLAARSDTGPATRGYVDLVATSVDEVTR